MLDRRATALIKPAVLRLAKMAKHAGITANQISLMGFLVGLVAAILIANSAYMTGALVILVSRSLDALDGAVARLTQPTDVGGFLVLRYRHHR